MIAYKLQIGKTSIYSILTENLEMRKICAKIVPKLLTPEQKLQQKQCCINSLQFFLVSKVQVGAVWAASGGRGNDYGRIDVAQRLEGSDFQGCFNQWK
jgi:hypothetical protein